MSGTGPGNLTSITAIGRGPTPRIDRDRPLRGRKGAPTLGVVPAPPPPKDASPAEREAWLHLKSLVDPLRVYSSCDEVAFEITAHALYVAREAVRSVRAAGLVTDEENARGQRVVKAHPSVQVMLTAQKLLWFALSRWGCSPADRARISGIGGAADEAVPGRGALMGQFSD